MFRGSNVALESPFPDVPPPCPGRLNPWVTVSFLLCAIGTVSHGSGLPLPWQEAAWNAAVFLLCDYWTWEKPGNT